MNTENFFCDENIINVYLGSPNHERNGDLFLITILI